MSLFGQTIQLDNQETKVVRCDDCFHRMVNVDKDQVTPADLLVLKNKNIRISNPDTTDEICVNCDVKNNEYEDTSYWPTYTSWFDSSDSSDDDDSSIFSGGSGFGGFGGGSFSGGGASGGF